MRSRGPGADRQSRAARIAWSGSICSVSVSNQGGGFAAAAGCARLASLAVFAGQHRAGHADDQEHITGDWHWTAVRAAMQSITPTELAVRRWGSSENQSHSNGARKIRKVARELYGVQHREWHFTPAQVREIERRLDSG